MLKEDVIMIKKSLLFILSLLFVFSMFTLNAYTVTDVNIQDEYSYYNSQYLFGESSYEIIVTVDDATGLTKIPVTIDSDKERGSIDFNIDYSSSNTFIGYFYIDYDSSSSSTHSSGWPKIIANSVDTITVSAGALNDTLMVDTVNPVVGNFTIESLGSNYSNYYSGDINFTMSGYSDADSGLSGYYLYLIDVEYNLENYSGFLGMFEHYSEFIEHPENELKADILGDDVSDGNYYAVIEVFDNAVNVGPKNDTLDNKKNIILDNTAPTVTSFNFGTLENGSTYYTDSNDFVIQIVLEDNLSGINPTNPNSLITVIDPNSTTYASYRDFNTDLSGFYVPIESSFTDGQVFEVSFDVNDYVNNNISRSFDIQIDSQVPTTPTEATLTRAIDNNITIASWGSSTDAGSGVKEYKVYRSESDFTNVTSQNLICTVSSSATKSCVDSSEKDDDTRYYYGVVAIDNAGNMSLVDTSSVKTGPDLTVEIDSDYTNDKTPDINLEFSNDVNLIRFSCNASTFTSWIEVSGDSEIYTTFDITSGNGCNSDDGKKTIYVEAKSEDDPYLVTRKYDYVKYDGDKPDKPTNVTVSSRTNGSLYLTWDESDDNYSGLDYYKVYYSTLDGVGTSSEYETTSNESYVFDPNMDGVYYIKISAVDQAGNESDLSSLVSGETKRFGPTFTLSVNPKSEVDDVIYLKKGISSFTFVSDETLKQKPVVKMKIGTSSQKIITPTTWDEDKTLTFDYNFSEENGVAEIEVTGKNLSDEESTDEFNFVIDTILPDFNYSYDFNNPNLDIFISSFSEDTTKFQYLLNDTVQLCLKEDSSDYNCSLLSTDYEDGNHLVSVVAYDSALNVVVKKFNVIFDNVDEDILNLQNIITQVNDKLQSVISKLEIFEQMLITIDDSIQNKLETVQTDINAGTNFYAQENILEATQSYNKANTLLDEIISLLPDESIVNSVDFNYSFDENTFLDIQSKILDLNVSDDTNQMYLNNAIKVNRVFSVQEISSEKYLSINLTFENTSNSIQTITYVEYIPKEFAEHISELIFSEEVDVLQDDPVIMHTVSIQPNSKYVLSYKKNTPITDFDVVTHFNQVMFSSPLVLSGVVTSEQIDTGVINNNPMLIYIAIGLVALIFILILFWIIASASKKNKGFSKPSRTEEMNKVLGKAYNSKIDSQDTVDKSEESDSSENKVEDSSVSSKDTFESNYEYILNAVKRNEKK